MEDIVLVGFGGHAKSVADCVERQNEYNIAGYTDRQDNHSNYKYLGTDDNLEELFNLGIKNAVICIGFLGKGDIREKLYCRLKEIGFNLPSVIDPTAIVAHSAIVREGTFIGKNAIINAEAKACLIGANATIIQCITIPDKTIISAGEVVRKKQ